MLKTTSKHTLKLTRNDVVRSYLELLPNTLADLPSKSNDQPKHEMPPLIAGSLNLLDGNEEFCAELCNHVAVKHACWLTLQDFLRVFRTRMEEPQLPSLNQAEFEPPQSITDLEDRQIARAMLFVKSDQYAAYKSELDLYDERSVVRALYLPDTENKAAEYVRYCMDKVKRSDDRDLKRFFFEPFYFVIPQSARYRHSFGTGSTGSGKSETLKHLIRYDIECNSDASVVVLDPHGKLAEEVAQFRVNLQDDRLVYIRPNWVPGHRVTINPFDITDKSEKDLELQTKTISAALAQVIGSDFTTNMSSLLVGMISVLLHRPGSDLLDLVRFANDRQNDDLVKYGATQLPYKQHRHFFQNLFYEKSYDVSKDPLRNRLQSLINAGPTLVDFTCGSRTVDLEAAIEQRKTIILDLRSVSKDNKTAIGQFVTALIQGYSERRAEHQPSDNPSPRIFLYADECQYFVSETTETILGESRKYGLHLTLATQRTDQVKQKGVLDAIVSNVGTQLVGRNKSTTLSLMSKELGAKASTIKSLDAGYFLVSVLGRTPVKIYVPETADNHAMTDEQWREIVARQQSQYYVAKTDLKDIPRECTRPAERHIERSGTVSVFPKSAERRSAPTEELAHQFMTGGGLTGGDDVP